MKNLMPTLLAGFTAVTLSLSSHAQSQAGAVPDDLRAALEMTRSDVNGFKILTLNQVMALTAPEAEAFWPIYRQYEKDLAAVGDRKLELIREFASLRAGGSIEQTTWNRLAQRWLKNAEDRLDLWKQYQKKIGKAVSPIRAAQFLQVEHQMALFIDLNIAAEMPLLGSSSAKP